MWGSRWSQEGFTSTWSQLTTVKWPSRIATPAGVCIQLFAERIHEAGRQHLECDQRTNGWSGHLREASKPETELKGEHDSRDNPNPEPHGKNTEPQLIDLEIYGLLRLQPKGLDHCQEGSKADRHRRKNDVKADRKGKLDCGENGRIECHDSAPAV